MESKSNYKTGCFQPPLVLIFLDLYFLFFTLQKAVDTANKVLPADTLEITEKVFPKSNSSA